MNVAIFKIHGDYDSDGYTNDTLGAAVTDWAEVTSTEFAALRDWLSSVSPSAVLVEQLPQPEVAATISECLAKADNYAQEAQKRRDAAREAQKVYDAKRAASAAKRAEKAAQKELQKLAELKAKYENSVDAPA